MAALGSIAAGALMVGTVGIASAAPTNNFSITTLTTDNDYAAATESEGDDDNGPIAITSTHVLWNSEDGVEAYAIADLSNPTVTDVGEDDGEHMFTNIKTATAHYLIGTEVDSTAVITGIGSIDDDGTSSSAAVIDLSEDIVISTAGNGADIDLCNLLGSGYGHLVIWDYCVGKMWNIDLPSGTVTVTEGVNTSADLQGVPTNDYYEGTEWFNQFGVVEHVDGEYSMVVSREDESGNDPVAVARFAITDPAGTVEDILALTGAPDFWEFAVNVEAELWCTHIEGGWDDVDSDDNLGDEPTICADATFSVADYLPSTGANSMFLVVTGLLLVAGGALALVRRPRIA
jgi:LPXTG-motif cell wall-anchored protein